MSTDLRDPASVKRKTKENKNENKKWSKEEKYILESMSMEIIGQPNKRVLKAIITRISFVSEIAMTEMNVKIF